MTDASEAAFVSEAAPLEAVSRQVMEPEPETDVVTIRSGRAQRQNPIQVNSKFTAGGVSPRRAGGARAAAAAGDRPLKTKREPSLFETEGVIANDRDLLRALGLTDVVASTYVLKSRQTLNNQLGARRDSEAPTNYFKPAELLMLVLAAVRDSPEFDEARKEEVREYIERTRGRGAGHDRAYALLMETLTTQAPIDLTLAKGVIFLLPEFYTMEREDEEAIVQLSRVVRRADDAENHPWSLILSSTPHQAKRAAEVLGLSAGDNDIFTASHDNAEHYMPAMLVYEGGDRAKAYVVTARGNLAAAPMYRSPMMLTCLKEMLPEEVRKRLFKPEESRTRARS